MNTTITITIGELGTIIKHAMFMRGMSSVKLAKESGVSRATIWRMARGETSVSFDKFIKVFKAMGVPITITLTAETE